MGGKPQYTLNELIEGLEVELKGDGTCLINGVSTIQEAQSGRITFLMNPAYKKYLPETKASAVILMPAEATICPTNSLICHDPYYIYAKIAAHFDDRPELSSGIHPTAVIGNHCQIDPSVRIGANCVIGDHVKLGMRVAIQSGCVINEYCEIDDDSYLHANVTLYHKIKMGKRTLIGSGTVIGSDGFGIAKHKGRWHKVPQLGKVVIGDDVEIGANCTIDRGAIGDTVLETGVKLDNLIQIGHNVRIGEHTAIAACVGVAGSTTIGKSCLIGGQAGFSGHLNICDNVMITGGAAVTRSIREPGIYSSGVGGVVTNKEWQKNSARINRLDKLIERVKLLETTLAALTERNIT